MGRFSAFLVQVAVGLQWVQSAHAGASSAHVFNIPAPVQPGNSTANYVFSSSSGGIDGPKVAPITNSTFQWWYFDVVSTEPGDHSYFVGVFYTTAPPAFPLLSASDLVTPIHLSGAYSNGTLWSASTMANGATISVKGDTVSGVWNDSGMSWSASSASQYLITIDAPTLGITGTITFNGIAPAHLPCGAPTNGATMLQFPQLGWTNAIPDADAVVDFQVNGESVVFKGSGYHDQNWSNVPLVTHVQSWYWGHGRVGPYSIVWFDGLDLNGTEHVSAYVAQDNKISFASCTLGSIQVRPIPDAYPPVVSTPNPTGYTIDIPDACDGGLKFEVGNLTLLGSPSDLYARFSGSLSTGKHQGVAFLEQFKLTATAPPA
ncbi:hypothetical protein HMN09_00672200 [Mycena chlorophos]|uniref:Hydroxyneurosporene synthase n=1 Tax=Mycena chlorophos TaxID=658473 RepID=A0A8H6SZN5_MYCCL|nr:hypothetical protein HMN09_00672200 [Mycena chlorophos]